MKSRLYFLFVLFFLAIIAVDTQAQIVVTVPSPGCNAPGTYTENGTLNGKPRYLGPGDFPYEIVWLNTHWECHFPNNTALRFVNMNDTPLPPCGQWPRGDGAPCGQAFMTVTSVNGTPCPVACPDDDMDEICNNMDNCPNTPNNGQADTDNDGVGDACDGCPNDPNKTSPGTCGCGVADTDSDNDSTPDCNDGCPNDPNKIAPGICGCG
ncbi:MAG TPA: thrombospondin type 3 repeat-containing protein, partial [Saprospiraceae bacterium]|nr:thrombospondin type 3 repeat-containing protein [Saprospiraceae bacterium]